MLLKVEFFCALCRPISRSSLIASTLFLAIILLVSSSIAVPEVISKQHTLKLLFFL